MVEKSKYFTEKICLAKDSTKELFKTVTPLSNQNNSQPIASLQEFCNRLAEYFQSKVSGV